MLSHVNREACLLPGALVCPNPGGRHLGFRPYNPRPAGNSGGASKAGLENVGTDRPRPGAAGVAESSLSVRGFIYPLPLKV